MLTWCPGGILTFCGLSVWLDFGLAIPRSGGEKNYLEHIYRHPKYLATCVLASQMILLGFSSGNSLAFGRYILYASGSELKDSYQARGIGVACATFAVVLHAVFPKWGIRLFNVLGVFKVAVLVFIVFSGFAALAGRRLVPDPHNFDNAFKIESGEGYGGGGAYAYSNALLNIVYSYKGWENANYVLSEIRDPRRTLTIAAPLAVGGVTILYVLANVAYFAAIPKADLATSEVIVAGLFFKNVFGDSAGARSLPAFVALSNLGNVLAVSFAHARLNQELGKEGLLPLSRVWGSNKPFNSPAAAVSRFKLFPPLSFTDLPSSSSTGSSPSSSCSPRRPAQPTTSSSTCTRTRARGSTASSRRASSTCSTGGGRSRGNLDGARGCPSRCCSFCATPSWPSCPSSRLRTEISGRTGTRTTCSPWWAWVS